MGKISSQRLRRSETVALIRKGMRLTLPIQKQPEKSATPDKPALGDWFNEGGQ
jgi:hypothetical protein